MARPRTADRLDVRGRALAAAIEIVTHEGAEALTMQAVAAAAGCRAPALYRYFPSRDALLAAVHDHGFQRLAALKLAADAGSHGDPLARLRQGGLAYVRFAFANPGLYALMFEAVEPRRARAGGASGPFAHDAGIRAMTMLEEAVVACQAAGHLAGLDPAIAAFTLWSAVHGAVSLAAQGRHPQSSPREAAGAAEAAVEVMMRLIENPGVRQSAPPTRGLNRPTQQ